MHKTKSSPYFFFPIICYTQMYVTIRKICHYFHFTTFKKKNNQMDSQNVLTCLPFQLPPCWVEEHWSRPKAPWPHFQTDWSLSTLPCENYSLEHIHLLCRWWSEERRVTKCIIADKAVNTGSSSSSGMVTVPLSAGSHRWIWRWWKFWWDSLGCEPWAEQRTLPGPLTHPQCCCISEAALSHPVKNKHQCPVMHIHLHINGQGWESKEM